MYSTVVRAISAHSTLPHFPASVTIVRNCYTGAVQYSDAFLTPAQMEAAQMARRYMEENRPYRALAALVNEFTSFSKYPVLETAIPMEVNA